MVTARFAPSSGGIETHVREVSHRLAALGLDMTVLTTDVTGRSPASEQMDGVRVRRVRAWPAQGEYFFAPGLHRPLSRGRFDLVHCQGYATLVAPLAMLAAQRARIPYVVTLHSGGHSSRIRNAVRPIQWAVLRPLLVRSARLVAVSRFEESFFRARLGLSASRFVVIPNGGDLPPSTGTRTAVCPLIISIGRLERYKGHHRVIAALPYVARHFPEVRLRIIGSGPFESRLHSLAQQLGVRDRVEISSIPVADRCAMGDALASASLVTCLSEYESQGIGVLEALALRRPVLVAATSALQEFADRGLARSVPLGASSDVLADAMIAQLRQPLVPAEVTLPNWDSCAAQLLSLYRAIAGGTPCGS